MMKKDLNTNFQIHKSGNQESLKKQLFLLISILFILPFTANSQDYFYYKNYGETYYNWNTYNPFNSLSYIKQPENLFKKLHISTMKMSFQYMKKEAQPFLYSESMFDTSGREISVKKYNRKGKNIRNEERRYDEKGVKIFEKVYNAKGRIFYSYEFINDENKKVTEYRSYDKNNNLNYRNIYKYNEKRNVTENCSYRGKKQKLYNRLVYTYYSNGEKESTSNYNGKGKLIKFWSYACSTLGTETKNLKDTVKVCKIAEYDKDGGFSITNIITGEDGQLSKQERKYNVDSVLIGSAQFNSKNKYIYKSKTDKTEEGWQTKFWDFFVKQQTISYERIFTYNDKKQLTNSIVTVFSKNGKVKRKVVTDYNNENKFNKISYYKKGGKLIDSTTEYIYNENNLPILILAKDETGKITKKTIYQYQ